MSGPWEKFQPQAAPAAPAAPKPWERFTSPEQASAPPPTDERDPLWAQFGGKVIEGAASLPGLPIDAMVAGGNFIRRQFDAPEVDLNDTIAKDWGGQGWWKAAQRNIPGLDKVQVAAPTNDAERLAQKGGLFFGGALPFGAAGMLPTATAVGGSEVGRAVDQAAPEYTNSYGEAVGALAGSLAPSAARRGLVPRTTPEQAQLAETLMANDVPVYPGQLATNPVTRNIYDLSNKLSVYDNGAQARQSDALTRVIARTMGEDETNLVQASQQAHDRLSGIPDPASPVGPKLVPGEFDTIYARIGDHRVDNLAVGELQTLEQRALQLSGRSRAVVENALDNIHSALDANGRLTIRGFKDLTDHGGSLSELANNANPALALYGRQLRQILENNIRRQASPADAQALNAADRQWRHKQTLEPLVARSANAEGQVSPALMQNTLATATSRANARGAANMPELETIARAGKSFLKNPISSGTAERNALVGLLTGSAGTGGFIAGGPVGAAAGIGASVAGPLVARHILQRQWLTRAMIDDALRRGQNPNTLRRMLTRTLPVIPGATQQQLPGQPTRMLTRGAAALPGVTQQH